MKQEMTNERQQIVFGNDSVVIAKYISGLKGGRTLNVEGFGEANILAGHVVITKDGVYKPMPVVDEVVSDTPTGNKVYGSLPAGWAYAGVVYRSVSAKKPAVSIMTNGEVNIEAVPYPMTSILSAFKAVVPFIAFIKDEEA